MIYINIGSNLNSSIGDKFQNINETIKIIKTFEISIKKISNFYVTPSYPNKSFPKYANICLAIKFNNDPKTLLNILKRIEKKMGRINSKKNDPRICDIDIIDFNQKILHTKHLELPHPKAHKRNFVLFPLREICDNWRHPLKNMKIDTLVAKLNTVSRLEITRVNKSAIFK
tara:strand:- start:465 stop:977 length:513 start_codon:yes stop_codon:yes gene_type:complete